MLNNITPIDKLQIECQTIQEYLEEGCSEELPLLSEYGSKIAEYMARSGKMLADSKHWKQVANSKAIRKIAEEYAGKKFPPALVVKDFIESECQIETHLLNWVDRLNTSCTHRLDWCRTLISKGKEELRLNMQR